MIVEEAWEAIETWLAVHASDVLSALPAGASSDKISEVEDLLRCELPTPVRAFFHRHDGSGDQWLHEYGPFASLTQLHQMWKMEVDLWADGNNDEWAQPEGTIKARWWSEGWVPIIINWSGDYVNIDLDPPSSDQHGQIFSWYHDAGPCEVLAPGFEAFFAAFSTDLQENRYRAERSKAGHIYLEPMW